ncbi:MAG: hypothetical protein P1U89_14925 [Verrucomicrobiales bacterium]|nr:hypothetical protein [Verrucomicrobiales bacterium]
MRDINHCCTEWLESIRAIKGRLSTASKDASCPELLSYLDQFEIVCEELNTSGFKKSAHDIIQLLRTYSIKLDSHAKAAKNSKVGDELRKLSLDLLCASPLLLHRQIEESIGSFQISCKL